MTKEQMKKEALKRMGFLKIHENPIKEFEGEGKINKSEFGMGILYWLDDEEYALVKAFEEEHNCLVYHVIVSHTTFGTIYDYLYVSECESEWQDEDNELSRPLKGKDDYREICSYAHNNDNPWCDEFGYIGIREINGGVKRVA